MAAGRGGEHVRGRGPRPAVPTRAQALAATERLLVEVLRLAGDDELVGVPGPEDMLGVVRYVRDLARRERALPWEEVLVDRAVVTRYLRDALDREDHETLRDMARIKMTNIKQSEAFGWGSKQAAGQRRKALERMFAETVPVQGGRLQRAPRTSRHVEERQERQRRERAWISAHEEKFVRVSGELIAAAEEWGLGRENREWLEELADEVTSAQEVTGDWASAVLHLKVAAADIRRELMARDGEIPAESLVTLERVNGLLTALEESSRGEATEHSR